jgi:8-oxo-dGTP pyrophosphatase MutT (NUDIX family)
MRDGGPVRGRDATIAAMPNAPTPTPAASASGTAATPGRFKPSITVAAVIEDAGRYLLVEEMTREGLKLNNPAGGIEPGESPLEGAIREALEETARHFTPQALLGVYMARNPMNATGRGITYLRFAFCGTAGDEVPGRALDSPIVRTLWLTPDEIRAEQHRLRGPLVLACIEDHLRGQRFPLDAIFTDPSVYSNRP